MGYYIETDRNLGKAAYIVDNCGGTIVPKPKSFADVPAGKAIICVVDNGRFEAAGYCYDEMEFKEFASPSDYRMKTWVLIDEKTAKQLTGYNR